jgi:hypothetical protein
MRCNERVQIHIMLDIENPKRAYKTIAINASYEAADDSITYTVHDTEFAPVSAIVKAIYASETHSSVTCEIVDDAFFNKTLILNHAHLMSLVLYAAAECCFDEMQIQCCPDDTFFATV